MTIWFRIPASRTAAFQAAYLGERVRGRDAPDEDEKAVLVPNADGTMLMTGSSRATAAHGQRLRDNNPPWLEVFDHWPPTAAEGGWRAR
jgi:hypothetical protein